MASGTRSSKRKSSPSIRKKRRIKDRNKKRSKTLKGKSKKVSRRESPDSYSDSESLSSASLVSYSSSDTDSRRSRSRTRKDAKKSRGSRLRSKSIDNTVKERRGKRSKKSKGTEAKKKSLRKKRKREPSISSSDRSVSCSTCRSSDDSEGENQKTEKRMKISRRDLGDDHIRWGGHRSRSRSPCRLDAVDGSYLSVEQHLVENNPRRLRSIIIVAKEFEEEEETEFIDRDMHKEEIICDQDDYPSPRSNDSHDTQVPHGKIVGSKVDHDMITSTSDQAIVLGSIEVSGAKVSSADGSNPTDLEAVLRQKALENLKKFKGGMRPNAKKLVSTKSSIDGELKQSSSINGNLELLKKDQEGNVECTMGESSALNQPAAKILPILTQDLKPVNDVEKLEGGVGEVSVLKERNLKESNLAEQALPTQETPLINMLTTESLPLPSRNGKGKGVTNSVDSVKDKQETVSLEVLGSHKLDNPSMIPTEEDSMAMSAHTKSKDIADSVQPPSDAKLMTDDIPITATLDTSVVSNLEGQNSNSKAKEQGDSQFQQKTMSVMRGGEMVQVNYKVYIPKHAPALARRKLKR